MPLPLQGRPRAELLNELRTKKENDGRWEDGRTFYLVYGVDDDHLQTIQEAHSLYIATNGLGSGGMFKSLGALEADIIGIARDLLGGSDAMTGNITSGGSESIFMGMRDAVQRAKAERPHVTRPEMILPISGHPAFWKAADVLGITPVVVPLDADYRADVKAVANAVTPNTIVIIGSAPNYPFGTIDPIPEMAEIALRHGVNFHTDACVGGFALPFLRKLGEDIPPFDFSVPGVSTISADLHKYGFAARGTSLILYREAAQQQRSRFVLNQWSAGPYGTPTLAGSRPGGVVAAAWAIMQRLGEEGYLRLNKQMLDLTRYLQAGIGKIPGFKIMGKPAMYVFAFTADGRDLAAVAAKMSERGWYILRQPTTPESLHLLLTPIHQQSADTLLQDLRETADASPAEVKGIRAASYTS